MRAWPNLLELTNTTDSWRGHENAAQVSTEKRLLRSPPPTCSGSGIKGCWCWVRTMLPCAPPPPKTPSRNTVGGTSIVVFSTLERKGMDRQDSYISLVSKRFQVLRRWERGGLMGLGDRSKSIQTRTKETRKPKTHPSSTLARALNEPSREEKDVRKQASELSVTRQSSAIYTTANTIPKRGTEKKKSTSTKLASQNPGQQSRTSSLGEPPGTQLTSTDRGQGSSR